MNQKGVIVLGVATLTAVVVAALALREDADASTAKEIELFEGLDERVNDVAEIAIAKGGKTLTLRKEAGKWGLADRGNYPAKFDKVKETVVRVAALAVEEKKTARPEYHERLGLANTPAEDSETATVALRDASGAELASVIVGKTEYRGREQKVYVRKAGEDQVYLCSAGEGRLDLDTTPSRWIDSEVLKLENDRVQEVSIVHADGEEVRIGRSPANHTQFRVENLPPGKNERYEGIANPVGQALSSLTLEDVRPASEVDFAAEPVAQTRYRCHDGLEILVVTAKADDKTWAKISARYEPPPAPEASAEATPSDPQDADAPAEAVIPDAGAASDAPEAGADDGHDHAAEDAAADPAAAGKTPEELRKEAEELDARLAPWAFAIQSYKSDYLTRRMKDLLEAPPAEEAEAEGSALAPDETPAAEGEPVDSPPPATDEDGSSAPPADSGEGVPPAEEEPRGS